LTPLRRAARRCAASRRLGLDAERPHICVHGTKYICAESARPARSPHTCPILTERSQSPLSIGTFPDHVTAVTARHMTLNPAPPPSFWNP
ncbi:unnamed protein product, partial [Staurois parvus]